MISRKHSYNPSLKSRKFRKNYELNRMSGSGLDKECVIKLVGTCLEKGFTLSDVLKHNEEQISKYDSEQLRNYENNIDVVKLLPDLPVYLSKDFKFRSHEHYTYNFYDLFFLEDLLKLNITITDDEKKKYIDENNLYDFFRRGVLTYGETQKRYKELEVEIKDAISNEKKKVRIYRSLI